MMSSQSAARPGRFPSARTSRFHALNFCRYHKYSSFFLMAESSCKEYSSNREEVTKLFVDTLPESRVRLAEFLHERDSDSEFFIINSFQTMSLGSLA